VDREAGAAFIKASTLGIGLERGGLSNPKKGAACPAEKRPASSLGKLIRVCLERRVPNSLRRKQYISTRQKKKLSAKRKGKKLNQVVKAGKREGLQVKQAPRGTRDE